MQRSFHHSQRSTQILPLDSLLELVSSNSRCSNGAAVGLPFLSSFFSCRRTVVQDSKGLGEDRTMKRRPRRSRRKSEEGKRGGRATEKREKMRGRERNVRVAMIKSSLLADLLEVPCRRAKESERARDRVESSPCEFVWLPFTRLFVYHR